MLNVLKRLWNGWRWVGHKIGHVNGIIVLAIFYFLVITPFGWLTRRLGRDPIHTGFDPRETSYWRPKSTGQGKSYDRPF